MQNLKLLFVVCFVSIYSFSQVIEENLYSEVLGKDRELKILLPRGYSDQDKKAYPVIYVLDGDYLFEIVAGNVGAENLQGPIGIAQISGHQASSGLLDLIALIGFISTAIGFLNLMPIPVLDGGHLVLYLYEAVFRRPPNPKAIQVVMTIGITMLLSLMLFATFNDIMRL